MDEREQIELVARACRILGKLDMTHGALGHVSWRLGDSEQMLIKGKGPNEVGLRYTSSQDILTVDFNADKVEGPDGLQPPSESYLHIWLYKKNPEVRSVVHMHPEHAVLLTICEKEILPIYGAFGSGARLGIEGVPTYQRSITIHDDQLGQDFASFMGGKQAAMMRGHGITVTGRNVQDATLRSLALDELTRMTYKAYLLGTPKPIPVEDMEEYSRPLDPNRPRGTAGGEAGMLATWRYYCMLTGEA